MKVLAMGIVSTFKSQRKYFRWASQVLAFFLCSFVTLLHSFGGVVTASVCAFR